MADALPTRFIYIPGALLAIFQGFRNILGREICVATRNYEVCVTIYAILLDDN